MQSRFEEARTGAAERFARRRRAAEPPPLTSLAGQRLRVIFLRRIRSDGGFLGGAVAALLLAGCRHLPPATGESSFEFQRANRTSAKGGGDYQPVLTGSEAKGMLAPPNPIGKLVAPAYPPAALAAHAGRARVVLQVTIGTDGSVTQVMPALAGLPFASPFTDEFQAAAEAAVRRWRFEPAEFRRLEPRDYRGTTIWTVTHAEKREMTVEVAFTFTETGAATIDRK